MGIFKTLGLSESEKNEIGSYKYDKALEILEDLDKFCLKKSDNKFTRIDNFFDLKEGIKIGKYEIGGATLDDFFRDLKIGTIGFAKLANEDNRKHIFWIRNSETDEIKTYSKFESNGVRIFYDTEKDELFTYDENGKDNLYVGLQNVKHYYARNYSTIDGFKFLDDDIRTPLSVYKLDEIFSCNFKELQATGTWSNQNEFNTLKKDQEKYVVNWNQAADYDKHRMENYLKFVNIKRTFKIRGNPIARIRVEASKKYFDSIFSLSENNQF